LGATMAAMVFPLAELEPGALWPCISSASIRVCTPADNAGLQNGEVITEVNRKPMHSAADVQKALSEVPKDSDALVLVWSNAGSSFRVLHPTQG
jgi:membrane-associated protease RseP (regulator of RpoE activity)